MPGKLDAVGFIIKSMVERDPSKRRVKPSQQALEEFEGLALQEDSSDDSDYKVDEKDEDDDGDSNFSGDDDDDNDDDKGNEESGSGDSSDEAGGEEEDAEVTVSELLSRAAQDVPVGDKAAVKRIKVCSVCLGDRSSDQNEIVVCDSCHVTVHEGCNGISESHSVGSSASSDPTEPWFCDACRAGATRFECDLCPNTGGLLKETDTSRWVHLVCALYVPGVAFGDVDRLTAVTLFEIPYTRWGGKVCTVCEDTSLARTGVTIQCDAGMCKAAFHVTCAQRNGLLQEPRIDEEAADPYFAHCKLHTDKTQIRDRKRNYLAMRLFQRQEHPQKMEPARLQRKLGRLQQKYREQMQTRKPKWTPSMKLPRPISSSPYLLRCLQRRAALMGVDLDQGQHAAAQVTDVSRKWHLPPAFSMEFVSYFLDRSHRMTSMSRSLKELMAEKATLQQQENALRTSYAEMETTLTGLRQSGEQQRAAGIQLHRQLAALSGGKLKLPAVLQPPRVRKTSAGRASHKLSPTKLASHGAGGRLTLHECVECGASSEQHLLALCDTCHNHYHLACLDPPLTRMPRKSKTAGWECWRCAAAGSRAQSPQTLPDTVRGGRRTRQAVAVNMQAAAVNMQPQVKLEVSPQPAAVSPARRSAGALKKNIRSVYQRKDIKHPGVGRGNAPRIYRRSASAGTAGLPVLKTNVRLGVRESVKVDDRRISQIVTQSEAACSSVVVIEKLDDALVAPHEPSSSPAPKRRRPTAESLAAATAAHAAPAVSVAPAAATAPAAAPAGDAPAAAPATPAAGAAAAGAEGSKTPLTVTVPAAGSGSGDRPPTLSPVRSRRYGSIAATIDDVLEQVTADPSGGPPTPPPFVYEGRGRPPTLEPLKTAPRRGRPPKSPKSPKSPAVVETPAAAAAPAAAAPAEAPAPAAASTPRPRGRPPGSRGVRRGVTGVRSAGRPAGATPGRPRGRPPIRLITEETMGVPTPRVRTPGRPRGGGVRTPGRPRGGGARRRTKAEMAALNEFLARRRAERRSQSDASSAEGGAAEAAPPPPPPPPPQNGEYPEPPPLSAETGTEPAPAVPLAEVDGVGVAPRPNLVPAKRSGSLRKPGPKERAMLKAAAARRAAEAAGGAGAGAEADSTPAAAAAEEEVSPRKKHASQRKKPRRHRRTKAEMQALRLLSAQADGAEGASVPSSSPVSAEGSGAAPDDPIAAVAVAVAGEPGPSSSGRPVRKRHTKAEMQLYREQVLALKQARERHQQQRQKLLNKRRRQDQGREHVVEVMTDMKIKIRPVASEAAPSAAAAAAAAAAGERDGARAGSSLEGASPHQEAAEAAAGPVAALVCSNCELAGDAATTVRCDDCGRSYHLRCLVPPVSKTPKRHGYGWLCGNCSGPARPSTVAPAADPTSSTAPTPVPTPASTPVPAPAPAPAAAPTPVPTLAAAQEPGRAPVEQERTPPSSPPPPPPPSSPPAPSAAGSTEQLQRQRGRQTAGADPAPSVADPAPSQ